jgi:hypothetical protein
MDVAFRDQDQDLSFRDQDLSFQDQDLKKLISRCLEIEIKISRSHHCLKQNIQLLEIDQNVCLPSLGLTFLYDLGIHQN